MLKPSKVPASARHAASTFGSGDETTTFQTSGAAAIAASKSGICSSRGRIGAGKLEAQAESPSRCGVATS